MRALKLTKYAISTAAVLLIWNPVRSADPSEWAVKTQYGKTLVDSYEVPAATLKKWSEFKPSKKDAGESPIMNALLASTENWSSRQLHVRADKNPYVIVLKLKGHSLAEGDVATLWQAGWILDDGATKSTIIPSLSRVRVKAGEALLLAGASAASRFTEDRDVGVSIGMVSASNWQFDAARVEVWSGLADASWADIILSLRGALVGIALFGIVLWFRRR